MIKTTIVIPTGDVLPDGVVSAYFFLSQANAFRLSLNLPPVFDLTIGGKIKTQWLYGGHFGIKATPLREMHTTPDLIIVPGFIDQNIPLGENQWLIQWIKTQFESGNTEVASMCTGAFILAAAGALNGKKCTTHWAFKDSFRELFPNVHLEPDKIVTDEERTYTSGGAFSSLNLLLYIVEKFAGKETSIWLSKVFQVDTQRNSQRPFMILNQLYDHEDISIKKFQEFVEEHFNEEIHIAALAKKFAFSPRTLIRRFKIATGITPIEYIQQVRVEAAKRMLETGSENINEIIFNSGYRDGATFRKIFKRQTGLTPLEYRKKYKTSGN